MGLDDDARDLAHVVTLCHDKTLLPRHCVQPGWAGHGIVGKPRLKGKFREESRSENRDIATIPTTWLLGFAVGVCPDQPSVSETARTPRTRPLMDPMPKPSGSGAGATKRLLVDNPTGHDSNRIARPSDAFSEQGGVAAANVRRPLRPRRFVPLAPSRRGSAARAASVRGG